MNKLIKGHLEANIDVVVSQWKKEMEELKGENFFRYLPNKQVDKMSLEFAEMMIQILEFQSETEETLQTKKMSEFTEKVVRFGWSIKFVNRSIDLFANIAFHILENDEIIQMDNFREASVAIYRWISPVRDGLIQAYTNEWERTVNLQRSALQELSASLIPVFDKISVMPLVGTIDTDRSRIIIENLLEGIVKQRAEIVLIDITDVPIVDTMVAHHLIQATEAVRLIGSQVMLVGIRPEIAQTIVALGIDLKELNTTSTLQRGMLQALKMLNCKVVEVE